MKGMRTKGTDYDTNFGVLATNTGVELPLGRLQRTADKKLPEKATIKLDGTTYYVVPVDFCHVILSESPNATAEKDSGAAWHTMQMPSEDMQDDVYRWLNSSGQEPLKAEYKRTASIKVKSVVLPPSPNKGYDTIPEGAGVIGGDEKTGRVYYDGRPQSGSLHADTDEELMEQAKKIKKDLIAENAVNTDLYQDDSKWELRIYSAKKTTIAASADHISQLDNPPVSGDTVCELKRNGEVQFKGTYNECLHKLHNSTSYSWDWAMKHEGWTIDPVATEKTAAIYEPMKKFNVVVKGFQELPENTLHAPINTEYRFNGVSAKNENELRENIFKIVRDKYNIMATQLISIKEASKKMAAIYDNYGTRVTIETRAGDTNESYTMVTGMLKSLDILYREIRRYTVDPDRVVLEVMVRKQDLDVIKDLAKEAEKGGVKIYLSDNVSEGLKSKTIVTDDENLEQKVTVQE